MIRRWTATGLVALLLLAGCSSEPGGNETPSTPLPSGAQAAPPDGVPSADDAAAALAKALEALDISKVPMQSSGQSAQDELETIFAGMDGIKPKVKVGKVGYKADERAAVISLQFSLDVGVHPWTYSSEATMKWVSDQWRLEWSPSIIHSRLTSSNRMRRIVTRPERAPINDKDGVALAEEISLFEVGIDKSSADKGVWQEAARHLARILRVDAAAYEKKVMAGGEKQFVVAATLRQQDIPAEVNDVPGLYVREIKSTQNPTDGFAASILGTVGKPTAEMIEKSDGKLSPNDMVGLSGLQSRYNEQLGGVPGVRVEFVQRKDATEKLDPVVVFSQEQSVGAPIKLSLDRNIQQKAEDALSSQSGVASIVVIDVATGGVAAAANSKDAGDFPYATFGKYAPGSTFKIASALAMVRKGSTAASTVECPATHAMGSHVFHNYSGYSHTGKITLADAVAYSCNTAFTKASGKVTNAELHDAAASLGVGVDYDAGFRSYFGTVDPKADLDRAASMIGQGQVTMSPLGMAAVAASVAKGETVIPWLVEGHQAKSTAKPLTEAEAAELQKMMTATVDHGTGTALKGVATGAKSGTAEFGKRGALKTHAWMIAYNDKYAVAAFVEEGSSGGSVAGPLVQKVLS